MAESKTTALPSDFKAQALVESDRFRDLDRRSTYYDCTQHDWKRYDFDGRAIRPGPGTQQPLLTTEVAPFYVPLRHRRPSSPVRMGKIVVDAFTNLVFGEERWPKFLCPEDDATQDGVEALVKEAGLRVKMIEARNRGGAAGSVGMSWCFRNGKPRVAIHESKNLYVHEWADREELVVGHVSKVYLYPVDEYDREKGKVVRNFYWYRHDWDEQAETVYLPVLYRKGVEPAWVPDPDQTVEHGFGFCPFEWIQNLPSDDVDGIPDYHGQYEAMDTIDVIASVLARGTILNLDPTLVLKMNATIVAKTGVRKGSDNALAVGEAGDAKYLELAGTAIDAGIKLFQMKRRSILEACQAVVPDPDEVAASGTSSVAIKAIYQPMLGKAAVLREQYGTPLKRMLSRMLAAWRQVEGQTVEITSPGLDGADDTTEEAVSGLLLPPKSVKTPKVGDDGIETGDFDEETVEHEPGEGERVELGWGEWFPMTATDRAAAVTALTTANGSKPIVSQQTAVEEGAVIFNRNPNEEWKRVKQEGDAAAAKQAEMFVQTGIPTDEDGNPKPGQSAPGGVPGGNPKVKLSPGDDTAGASEEDGNPFAKKKK